MGFGGGVTLYLKIKTTTFIYGRMSFVINNYFVVYQSWKTKKNTSTKAGGNNGMDRVKRPGVVNRR